MPRFCFNHLDGEGSYPEDDDGFEYPSTEVARREAAQALAEAAGDELWDNPGREIAIEVLDEDRRPLFRVAFRLEVQDLAGTR